jgi:enoyl-CoA hydratase/carnithine racemase
MRGDVVAESLVQCEKKDEVAWVTLNNPGNMNALSLELLQELERVVDDLGRDRALRCVVLTGAGRAFSAGGDLRGFLADLADESVQRLMDRLRYAQELFLKIEALPMPVIAAVNGYAIAGGLELVLCCDIVVAAESARLGDGHARFGVIPAGGASVRLPRKIAANRANQMLLTAELFPARTLHDWGLVNVVAEDARLLEVADELSRAIARHSPYGLRVIKKLAGDSVESSPAAAWEAELTAFRTYAGSHDFREGLSAFVEKRTPVFTGQ